MSSMKRDILEILIIFTIDFIKNFFKSFIYSRIYNKIFIIINKFSEIYYYILFSFDMIMKKLVKIII